MKNQEETYEERRARKVKEIRASLLRAMRVDGGAGKTDDELIAEDEGPNRPEMRKNTEISISFLRKKENE